MRRDSSRALLLGMWAGSGRARSRDDRGGSHTLQCFDPDDLLLDAKRADRVDLQRRRVSADLQGHADSKA